MNNSEFHALVVDDEELIRKLLSRALEGEGISSDGAADGADALKRFESVRYDLVVTDLRMPNLHGHALAVDLLEREQSPCVFILTGVAELRLVKDLLARGALDVKTKPVDFKMFAKNIRSKMDAIQAAESRSNGNFDAPPRQEGIQSLDTIEQIESYLISEMDRLPPELLNEVNSFEVTGNIEVPQDIKEFVTLLSRPSPYARNNRRKLERIKAVIPVQCVAYNKDFNFVGTPFLAYIRDISPSGVGIVSRYPLENSFLTLSWSNSTGKRIHSFIEICRCQAHKSLYDVGGEFVNDF